MKSRLNASYTIEAAFVLPLVFALLMGIIFLGFYLHDSVVLQQCAWEGAFYGAGQTKEVADGEIYAYVEARLKKRLLVSELTQLDIDSGKTSVKVTAGGKAKVLNYSLGLLGYHQARRIKAERAVSYPAAAEYVRRGLIISGEIKGLWKKEED